MPDGLSLAHFDAVLFDVDGTLVDSLGMLVPGLGDAIEKYAGARPSDDEIQALIGMPIKAQLERYLAYEPSPDDLAEMTTFAIERYECYKDRERIYAPAVEALRLCHRSGLRTALVTSKNAVELSLFIQRFPGIDAVDAAICASDVENPKPAPDSAFLALSRLRVAPERAVMIGDSIYDMRCARAAGIATIAVGYGSAAPEALAAEHPDLLLNSPDDLLAWANATLKNRNAPQEEPHRFIDDEDDERTAGAA